MHSDSPNFRTIAVEELEQIAAAIERALPIVAGAENPRPGEDDPSGEAFMEYVHETTMAASELKIAADFIAERLRPLD